MRAAWTNSCIQGTCVHAKDFYSDQVDLARPGSKMSQTSMQRAARSQSSMNFRDLATQKLSSRASNHSFAEGGPCQQSNQTMLNAKRGWAHATTRAETEEGPKGATCGEAASCARVKRLTCNICAHQLFLKLVSCLH